MKRHWHGRWLRRLGKVLPFLVLYQTIGCLPENGLQQVTAENVILTSAIVIQTLTSIFFNRLFGVA